MYSFFPNRPSDMDKKAPQGAIPKQMWIDETGVPGYSELTHGPRRPRGKPSKFPHRRLGSGSTVRAECYAYHNALSWIEIAKLVNNGQRGKTALCKNLLLSEC